MSDYTAYGHEQIETWFHRTYGNRRVQGIISTNSPPPPLPAGKKRSGPVSLSRPKTRAILAQVGVSPTVNPTHAGENTTCHAQTVDCRRPRTAVTAKRNSLPENLPRPANIPQPKLPQAQYSPQNLEGTPRCKDKPASPVQQRALRWSVTKLSSWQKPLLPTAKTQWNSSTTYLLVRIRCFIINFYFCIVAGKVLRHEELPWTSTRGHLQQQPSRQKFPFSVLPGVAGACSVEVVAHWPSARITENWKKR